MLLPGLLLGQTRRQLDDGAQRVAASLEALRGQPVAAIRVECDTSWCTDPERNALVLRLTRMQPGAALDPEAVARAWARLMRTTYFRQLAVEVEQGPGGLGLHFKGVGQVTITRLDIGYASFSSRFYPQQFTKEIRKRVLVKKGGPFPPPEFAGDVDAFVQKQRAEIVRLYSSKGYEGTEVELRVELGDTTKEVELEIIVDEGRQPRLGGVLVKGNEARGYAELLAPVTTGERADFWQDLFGAFGVGRYARRSFKDELRVVEENYREDGYVGARVRLDEEVKRKGAVYPRVRVHEGQRLVVRFEGVDALSHDALEKVLTFKTSGAYDETAILDSERAILQAYQAVAHYSARIRHTVKADEARKEVLLTFEIDEGPRTYVSRVEIRGNAQMPPERILAAMETKGVAPNGVLGAFSASAGVLQDGRVANDLTAIRALYYNEGFSRLRFRCTAPEGAPKRARIWSADPVGNRCFVIIPERDPRLVVLRLEVEEGRRATTDGLNIDVLLANMDERLRDRANALLRNLGFKDELDQWREDAGLNRRKLRAVQRFLLRYYDEQGNLLATIEPICGGSGRVSSRTDWRKRSCNDELLYGRHVKSVEFDIEPGPKTLVDGILLAGALRTRQSVIRNEMRLEAGKPLASEALALSQASLRSLGIFDSVSVRALDRLRSADEESREEVPASVLVTVEEGSYRLLDTYLGLSVETSSLEEEVPVLYQAGLTVRDRNLLGRAVELGVGGAHSNRVEAPLDIDGDKASWEAGPFFRDRRFLGTRIDMLIEGAFQQGQTAQKDEYERVFSGKVTFGYDFFNLSYPDEWGRGLRQTLGIEYRRDRRRDLESGGVRPSFRDATHSIGIQPAITWDRRDNPLHPTRGWFLSVGSEVLFNSDSTLPSLLNPSFKESFSGQYVRSFFERRLIVVPSFRLGAVQSDELEEDLKSGFYFKAGGDGVPMPVRGYEDASIEACDGVQDAGDCQLALTDDAVPEPDSVGGRAMMLGSLELRFPTFLIEDFWFAAFADLGAVAPSWPDMSPDRFYPGVGGGLRWLVTGQIPLRLDVAYPLRETAFSPQELRVALNIFYSL